MNEFKFQLGAKVKDTITGFEGTIISMCRWLSNRNTYGVRPKAKDNEVKEAEYFDESTLELVEEATMLLSRIPEDQSEE